jgi:hypothetical protein
VVRHYYTLVPRHICTCSQFLKYLCRHLGSVRTSLIPKSIASVPYNEVYNQLNQLNVVFDFDFLINLFHTLFSSFKLPSQPLTNTDADGLSATSCF